MSPATRKQSQGVVKKVYFSYSVWSTKGLLNLKLDGWMDLKLYVNFLVHRFNLFQSVNMEVEEIVRFKGW